MKNLFLKLWAWVTGTSVKFYTFLAPILASNAGALLEQLAPIALVVVESYAESKLSGDEKRAAATERIKALAIQQGIKAGTDVVQTAIQLALLNIRSGEQGAGSGKEIL